MELTNVVGAVQDSGALDVTLEDVAQEDDNPAEVRGDYCQDPPLQTGGKETPQIIGAWKDSGSIHVTAKDDGHHGNDPAEVQEDGCTEYQCINRKCHQGTQTELWTLLATSNAVFYKTEMDASF